MESVKEFAKRVALVVFVADVVHVYTYLNKYYEDDQDIENVYDDERLYEDEKIVQAYAGDCPPESLISDAEYNEAVETMKKDLEAREQETGLFTFDSPTVKVNRESIVFAGAGRATFLQLAHPFIAAGIRQHSMLESGVSRRFYNTFKYMFGMTYGTNKEIIQSSRAVRGLHAKVVGEMQEDVGVFSSSSRFSAAEKNAVRFVAATLVETSVFEYEMHVRMLSEDEKDQMVREGARLLIMFGVKPSPNDPKTWREFRQHLRAVYRSKVLTVSETAKDTSEFLLLPPAPVYAPLLNVVKWSTAVALPPRIAKQYTGRTPNVVDKILFALFHAVIRFVYRLCPGSFRYLSAFWRMYDRVNAGKRSQFSKFVSLIAAKFTGGFLAMAMPPRDPEESRRKVQEVRQKRTQAQKIPNSPIKV